MRRRFPQKSANAGHINSLKQLEAAKADDYSKAIGLKDKYDVAGACVKCHSTVYQGDANAGVSCESCHGPASGYLKPHQTKGAYTQSLGLGLVDLVGKVATWAQQCTVCHVMDDQRLVTAGHPSGDDFDLGSMFGPVSVHFAKKYSETDVRALSRDMVRSIIAKRRGATGASPVAPVASAPVASAPASAPQRVAVPFAPGQVATPPTTGVVPPRQGGPTVASAVASQPAPPKSVGSGSGRDLRSVAVATPAPGPSTPPSTGPRVVTALPGDPVPAPDPLPASLSAAVALVQGRLIATLTSLVQSGATVPRRASTPGPAPVPYGGPDAALLQLQRDAIVLALDVLGEPPAPPQAR